MDCPACKAQKSSVSRTLDSGRKVIRVRECRCGCTWETEESVNPRSLRLPQPCDGFGRFPIDEETRAFVMQRDGGACRYCGVSATGIDHVVPLAARVPHGVNREEELSRRTGPGNLVVCCVACNSKKGAMLNGKRQYRFKGDATHGNDGTNSALIAPEERSVEPTPKEAKAKQIDYLDASTGNRFARDKGGIGGVSVQASESESDTEKEKSKKENRRRKSYETTAAFDEFWSLQIRKEAPKRALKYWHANGCEAIAAKVIAGWKAQLPEMKRREAKFVPLPGTWLNDNGWENETGGPRKGPSTPFVLTPGDVYSPFAKVAK